MQKQELHKSILIREGQRGLCVDETATDVVSEMGMQMEASGLYVTGNGYSHFHVC